jgi:hypothetical protein
VRRSLGIATLAFGAALALAAPANAAPPTEVPATETDLTVFPLAVDETKSLPAAGIEHWSVPDPSYFEVKYADTGVFLVTGKKAGTASLILRRADGTQRTLIVSVLARAPEPVVADKTPPPAPPKDDEDVRPKGPPPSKWGYGEPWIDRDPDQTPTRTKLPFGFGFRGGAEYRAQMTYVRPVSLNTETARNLSTIEQRLRLDGALDYKDMLHVVFSADVLDGVLWGDNGSLGGNPSSNAGANINAKNPNLASICMQLRQPGLDPLDSNSYGWGLCPANAINVRRMYGDVVTPFGLIRVGRQPFIEGMGVQIADGDGRQNRFGIAGSGGYVDRIAFATKPLEAFKPKGERDLDRARGLITAVAYDRLVTDSPQAFGDDVHQFGGIVRYGADKVGPLENFFLNVYGVHRWSSLSGVSSFGVRYYARLGSLFFGFDTALNVGSTREISAAYQKITNDPVVDQSILQGGARVTVRWDKPMYTLYLEGDYASGSSDPTSRATLSNFVWGQDTNVGLLLFKQTLAFQTARAAAAGTELLRRLGAASLPTEAIATRGGMTNAMVLFPQVDVRPFKNFLIRGGVMLAWTSAPLIDPVASLQRRKSVNIEDDLVNFAGGKPGRFYGTELDLRLQYRLLDHFIFDLEGAVLFPGDALQNQDGVAVRSFLVQGRTTFYL